MYSVWRNMLPYLMWKLKQNWTETPLGIFMKLTVSYFYFEDTFLSRLWEPFFAKLSPNTRTELDSLSLYPSANPNTHQPIRKSFQVSPIGLS